MRTGYEFVCIDLSSIDLAAILTILIACRLFQFTPFAVGLIMTEMTEPEQKMTAGCA